MQPQGRNKRAIVTGAASGIGRAVALRLLRDGIDVLAVDQDAAGLAALASDRCATCQADLADPEQRRALATQAADYDFLVNSAGVILLKPIAEVTIDDWRRVQTVNAEAVFFLSQQIGPTLRPGGAIVNLSSSAAKYAVTTEVAAYAASKATVLSITRSFAYAFAPIPIRVNAVCPGIIDTPMQDRVVATLSTARGMTEDDFSAARHRTVPLGRAGTAEECAGTIAFLLSDDATYMTGQAVNVTGGLVTW
jgi:NAD(P)-dependent dehydrogenase (short-subunit alcohol dehydrogenase family)